MAVNIFDPAFDIPHPVNVFPPAFDLTGVLPPVAIERYFTELASAGSQHYTIPEITLAGDYEVELEHFFDGSLSFIYGRSDNFNVRGRINADGSIESRPVNNSSTVKSDAGVVPLNKLSTVKFSRVGLTFYIHVNSIVVATGGTDSTSAAFDSIGRSSSGYANGIIANVRIRDNGTLVRSYDIDEDWVDSNVLVNDAAALGPELVVNGDFSGGTAGWSDNNGSAIAAVAGGLEVERLVAGATFPNARQAFTGLTIGETYQIESTLSNPTGSEVYHSITGIADSSNRTFSTSVMIASTFTATSTTHSIDIGFWAAAGGIGDKVTFSSVSIRQADGYGTAVNVTSADAQNYTFNGNVSPNTWTGDDTTVIEVAGT